MFRSYADIFQARQFADFAAALGETLMLNKTTPLVLDDHAIFEIDESWAGECVTGFGFLDAMCANSQCGNNTCIGTVVINGPVGPTLIPFNVVCGANEVCGVG